MSLGNRDGIANDVGVSLFQGVTIWIGLTVTSFIMGMIETFGNYYTDDALSDKYYTDDAMADRYYSEDQ